MMQLIRKPIYPDNNIQCNNNNVHEYTPYLIVDTDNIIDIDWWNT